MAAIAVAPLVRRPLAGAALAGLWVATYLALGADDGGRLVRGLGLCVPLVAATVTDLERRLIPNAVVLAGAAGGIAIVAATDAGSLPEHLAAAVSGGVGLLVPALVRPGGIGMGDVKLAAMMGIYLGRAIAPALLIALAAGALVGAAIVCRHGARARRRTIPFGPCLALGGVLAAWFGAPILDWYLDDVLDS
jgi:leader peptidase (prepilin peptidase) / N-methyltransferase